MDNRIIYKDANSICERVEFQSLQDKTILVTGASGLIGSYFLACLNHLKTRGYRIKVYCQFFSDPPEHILELVDKGEFNILQADLSQFGFYNRLPIADLIIHAAGYAQPLRFMSNSVTTYLINTSATVALLQHLRKGGRFLFLSSSEVYCGLKTPPFPETVIGTTNPLHPRAGYIEGKRGGEMICNAFRSQGVNATAVRLGDIYGPGTRKHDRRALNTFIEKAICEQKIDLMDQGSAIRSYCYVVDAIELMWKILLFAREPVYNLGGHSSMTIAKLSLLIGKIASAAVFFPTTQPNEVDGAPVDLSLDLSRIEAEFGKTEYTSIEDGLSATIEWQRSLYTLEK